MRKKIERAKGKLGILITGLGEAATSFIAGVEAVKKGLADPFGSLTLAANIKLNKKTGSSFTKLKDYVSIAHVKDIVFGGWDIYDENLFAAVTRTKKSQASFNSLLHVKSELEAIVPMKAVAGESSTLCPDGAYIKRAVDKFELAKQVMYDIENFSVAHNCTRLVVICFLPEEKNIENSEVHQSIEAFEEGLCNNSPAISPSMIYTYAALSLGVPFINGSGNCTCDIPALAELSKSSNTPVTGKRFKSWKTLNKAVYSHLSDVENDDFGNVVFPRASEVKPQLIKAESEEDFQITIYSEKNDLPRDGLVTFEPFGQYLKKVNYFLSGDFISEVCNVLDVALFIDLAKRAGLRGIQEWLSFYFIEPQSYPGLAAEHDILKQFFNLKNALHYLKSKDVIAHFDLDYYE